MFLRDPGVWSRRGLSFFHFVMQGRPPPRDELGVDVVKGLRTRTGRGLIHPAGPVLLKTTMPTRPSYHQPRYEAPSHDVARGTAAQRGYDSTWRRFRNWFIQEHPTCCFADHPWHKHECQHAAAVVDHIEPLPRGPRLDPTNCRSVCRIAHDRLTTNLRMTGRNELPPPELPVTGVWA